MDQENITYKIESNQLFTTYFRFLTRPWEEKNNGLGPMQQNFGSK